MIAVYPYSTRWYPYTRILPDGTREPETKKTFYKNTEIPRKLKNLLPVPVAGNRTLYQMVPENTREYYGESITSATTGGPTAAAVIITSWGIIVKKSLSFGVISMSISTLLII